MDGPFKACCWGSPIVKLYIKASISTKGHFMHVTEGHEKNDFGFYMVMVMVGGPMSMVKKNLHHLLKCLFPN